MSTPIHYWPYRLRSREPLNALTERGEYMGALLRQGAGFACLHPWPELGDLPLSAQLDRLRAGLSTPLIAAAFRCLRLDGDARERGVSLFENLPIPPSHVTLAGPDLSELAGAAEQGFTLAKVKASPDRLKELAEFIPHSPLSLRLDFNGTGEADSLADWLRSHRSSWRRPLDFIEDPCPPDGAAWERLRSTSVRLALDRRGGSDPPPHDVLVLKPAVDEVEGLAERAARANKRLVVTSYMEHPLGQAFAAHAAALLARRWPDHMEACGLATHRLFEPCAFSERWGAGPTLAHPGGTGLGFDDLLEKLDWRIP